jgi:hypothetical protein
MVVVVVVAAELVVVVVVVVFLQCLNLFYYRPDRQKGKQ